jgi:hypothetical protein
MKQVQIWDPGSGMEKILIWNPEKYPVSATLMWILAKYCSMESEQIPEDQDLCFISG